jgi:hypothetical protein
MKRSLHHIEWHNSSKYDRINYNINISLFVNPICSKRLVLHRDNIQLTEIESEDNMVKETTVTSTEMTQPVIIDLGKQRSKYIKELKNGEGELWDEVLEVADEVKEMLGAEAEGKILIPVIMLYQERAGRRRIDLEKLIFPLMETDDDDDDDDEE